MAGGYRYNPKSWYASGTRRYMRKASGIYFFDGKQSNRAYTEQELREAARERDMCCQKLIGIVTGFFGLMLTAGGGFWIIPGILLLGSTAFLFIES